jgi:DNA-binding PadR family transcriptional regulator
MPRAKSSGRHRHGSGKHGHRSRHGGGHHDEPATQAPDEFSRHLGRSMRGRRSGGRIFGPGDLRLMLLALIAEKPCYGYELIKAVENKFGGTYSPSPGSVYPTLTLLEELGHARAKSNEDGRRLFEITKDGREFLADNKIDLDGITARMGFATRTMSEESPPSMVFQAIHTLQTALLFHRGEWSAKEAVRVRDIIEDAAEAIGGVTRDL